MFSLVYKHLKKIRIAVCSLPEKEPFLLTEGAGLRPPSHYLFLSDMKLTSDLFVSV